jgi:hypothetical protein
MANLLPTIVELLKPDPQVASSEYSGTEYKYWRLAFRPGSQSFSISCFALINRSLGYVVDPFIFAAAIAYVALYFIGSYANSRLAHTWYALPSLFRPPSIEN